MKDFVLGRGEERRGGGRRRIILEALRELTAAAQVSAAYEPALEELMLRGGGHPPPAGSAASPLPLPSRLCAQLRPDVSLLPPPSRGLAELAAGGISISALLRALQGGGGGGGGGAEGGSLSVAAIKGRLSRSREDEAAFPRRLVVSGRGRKGVMPQGRATTPPPPRLCSCSPH